MQNDHPGAKLAKWVYPPYPEEFKSVYAGYFKDCETLANKVMECFAHGLEIDETFFHNKFDKNNSVLRTLFYPENMSLSAGQLWASEHTDYGALTLLYSTAPGLQAKNRDNEWIDVSIPWEHYAVNIGDLMAFWSNDRWVSTPHRVISKDMDKPVKRISLAFFHNPNKDCLIECIPSCHDEKNPIKYEKTYSGDFIMKKFHASIGEKKAN